MLHYIKCFYSQNAGVRVITVDEKAIMKVDAPLYQMFYSQNAGV